MNFVAVAVKQKELPMQPQRWMLLPLAVVGLSVPGPAQEAAAPVTAPAPAVAAADLKQLDVVRFSGSPEEIGKQCGTQLAPRIRIMLKEYVGGDVDPATGKLEAKMLARIVKMKPSLPEWFRKELSACAKAVGVDEDLLLYAQCEGDIKSLGGCTTYVAFGPATADGKMEIGRNFDYWGLESVQACCMVQTVVPRPEDGHAFVSAGWTGILGGWTFYNEKGLFVANNLGGGTEKNPQGIPTLILERIIAQKAATVDEALKIIRESPRMRGQALVIGQYGKDGKSRAVVVEYDGKEVLTVTEADRGFAFHSSIRFNSRNEIRQTLADATRKPYGAIRAAGNLITFHSIAIHPEEQAIWIAHGTKPAWQGEYKKYDLETLLKRPAKERE
jgi:hypothetical protein